jgi:hypothetical protein
MTTMMKMRVGGVAIARLTKPFFSAVIRVKMKNEFVVKTIKDRLSWSNSFRPQGLIEISHEFFKV